MLHNFSSCISISLSFNPFLMHFKVSCKQNILSPKYFSMHIINNSVSIIIDKMFRLGLHAIYKELQVEIGGSERPRGSERPSALKMSGTEATAQLMILQGRQRVAKWYAVGTLSPDRGEVRPPIWDRREVIRRGDTEQCMGGMLETKKRGGIPGGRDLIRQENPRLGSDSSIHTATLNRKHICHS